MRTTILTMTLVSWALAGCATVKQTAQRTARMVIPSQHCADLGFPIYFSPGSTTLTDPALQAIRMAAQQTQGCQAASVSVTGLADADGATLRNEALARDRATVVAQALAAQGLPAPTFDIQSIGAAGAKTASGSAVPARRRVEVEIQFKR